MSYKIIKYQKMFFKGIQRNGYTFDVIDNNCPNIKVGDYVEIDDNEIEDKPYVVESIEWSKRMFDDMDGNPVKGTNVTIIVK